MYTRKVGRGGGRAVGSSGGAVEAATARG